MLNQSSPPGLSTPRTSRAAPGKSGPSINAVKDTIASKLASVKNERAVNRHLVTDSKRSAQLLLARQIDHSRRQIRAGHPRSLPREKPGVIALAASDIEYHLTPEIADEGEEGGIVVELPVSVHPSPHTPGPRIGVVVPVLGDFSFGMVGACVNYPKQLPQSPPCRRVRVFGDYLPNQIRINQKASQY